LSGASKAIHNAAKANVGRHTGLHCLVDLGELAATPGLSLAKFIELCRQLFIHVSNQCSEFFGDRRQAGMGLAQPALLGAQSFNFRVDCSQFAIGPVELQFKGSSFFLLLIKLVLLRRREEPSISSASSFSTS
jgi:hypothetical protein